MTGARLGGKLARALLLLGVPLAVAAIALYFYATGGRHLETDNAYVKAHIVAVSAEVAGRVAEVAVRDNQTVTQGQLLFRIDPVPFETALARARAISKGTASMRNSSCPCATGWLSRTATSATRPAISALTATMWAFT